MKKFFFLSRRNSIKSLGLLGTSAIFSPQKVFSTENWTPNSPKEMEIGSEIFNKVYQTPFIDTHEHLIEEEGRFKGTAHPRVKSDDWTMVLSHYFNSDILTAGMPQDSYDAFFSPQMDPLKKWILLEPYWPYVKHTGYGLAVRLAIRDLYGVQDLNTKTVQQVQLGYEKVRRPGFYQKIIKDSANIESCQVNSLEGTPFMKSKMPTLLMQDLSIVGMFAGPSFKDFGEPSGIKVSSLSDWHRVINWWFEKYGKYAVAVKSQNAYSRDINYEQIKGKEVQDFFQRKIAQESLSDQEQKNIEDHLFWYAVQKATEYDLPVKLHTGYYAGQNRMPLGRLINNPASATDLCRKSPETKFVFMHICYPYYEELISVAKQYTNAYVDMCWSWIINPLAAKDFLKKYLLTAPANKILTFGGDFIPVEPVLGHANITRQGIAQVLLELVIEKWIKLDEALELTDLIMHENARKLFKLAEKEKILKSVNWG
jgi:predicted TIM-barrel fold metal-dependent hydrolase